MKGSPVNDKEREQAEQLNRLSMERMRRLRELLQAEAAECETDEVEGAIWLYALVCSALGSVAGGPGVVVTLAGQMLDDANEVLAHARVAVCGHACDAKECSAGHITALLGAVVVEMQRAIVDAMVERAARNAIN